MGFVPNSQVLRVNRNGLAQSGLAVADVVARAVNAEPQPAGIRSGIQVFLDGTAPVDKEPACDVNTNPLCDGGGPSGAWTNYSLETVQRVGYGSFEPDNGVLIAKNKAWAAGANRGTEGSQCGYNCFTWVEDAHPEDMNAVDYYKPDGTPIMRTVADYRQLNDALFHAGTNSGSSAEYVDAANSLHFYVIDKYTDARGMLHYRVGVQNPTGAGPQTRGVALATSAGDALSSCTFKLTNTGAAATTDPALHPQDERASLDNDIYRLSASASGAGWSAELRNALATAKFGDSVDVPVYISHAAGAEPGNTVTLTATSVSRPGQDGHGDLRVDLGRRRRRRLGAGDAVAHARRSGLVRRVPAGRGQGVLRVHGGHGHLDRGRRDADRPREPGHLTNGAFSLPEALQVSFSKSTWNGPASNDASTITFRQHIGAIDALRTGAYSKTLTFTLSTTNP